MSIDSIVQGIAVLLWLAAISAVGLTVFSATRRGRTTGWITVASGLGVLALITTVVALGLVFIQADERGVIISPYDPQGYRSDIMGPGLHWIIPGEQVKTYSISRQTYTMSAISGEGQVQGDDSIRARTSDGQEVLIDASIIYSVDPANIINLHITWQDRYEDGVVRALARGIIRDAASGYGIQEIISTKRAEMENLITDTLTRKLAENSLLLEDFILRDVHFTDEYAAAVEQKQIAEQQAQQAAYVVEQRKQEADQAREVAKGKADAAVTAAKGAAEAQVIQAEADAKALQLISAALKNNPELLTYRYIEKLAPNVQVMYLPSSQAYLLPLPTPSASLVVTDTNTLPGNP